MVAAAAVAACRFNDFYARYQSLLSTKPVSTSTTAATTTTTTSAVASGAAAGADTNSYQAYVPISRRRQMEAERHSTPPVVGVTQAPATIGSTATTTVTTTTTTGVRRYAGRQARIGSVLTAVRH